MDSVVMVYQSVSQYRYDRVAGVRSDRRSGGHRQSLVRGSLACAMAEVAQRHTGAGIARRSAFHERLRAERLRLEASGGLEVPAEDSSRAIVVNAADVLAMVAEAGPNYFVLKKTESKKERRKRKRDELVEEERAIDEGVAPVAPDAVEIAPAEQLARRPTEPGRLVQPVPRAGVLYSALADALDDEAHDEEEEATSRDEVPITSMHGPGLTKGLIDVRRRLREFLAAQAEAGRGVPMQQTAAGAHPTMRWTIRFGKFLATTRKLKVEGERVAL